MSEHLITIPHAELRRALGQLDLAQLAAVETVVRLWLGLSASGPRVPGATNGVGTRNLSDDQSSRAIALAGDRSFAAGVTLSVNSARHALTGAMTGGRSGCRPLITARRRLALVGQGLPMRRRAPSDEGRREVHATRSRMDFRDVGRQLIRGDVGAAEPTESLAWRDRDALHSLPAWAPDVRTSNPSPFAEQFGPIVEPARRPPTWRV